MIVMQGYFDDSKRFDNEGSANNNVLAIAGYFAPAFLWEDRFSPAWRRALTSGPSALPEFKANHARNMKGAFDRDWTRQDVDDLMRLLVSNIIKPGGKHWPHLIGLGTAVEIRRCETREERRLIHAQAYDWCARHIISQVLAWCMTSVLGRAHRVELIFDLTNSRGSSSTSTARFERFVSSTLR